LRRLFAFNCTMLRSLRPLAASMLFSMLLGVGAGARAWGEQGHRITGLVAEQLLSADARAGLRALMGDTDLATLSLAMDRQRDVLDERMPGSREWHYDNRPVCDPQARRPDYCANGHCASVQIARHYRQLTDPRSSRDQRRFALQVLVHLIGDLHQPLHASDDDDHGGNGVRVTFTTSHGRQRRTNLHAAWDTDFVRMAFSVRDERRIARQLVSGAGDAAIRAMQKGDAAQWVAEAYAIGRDVAYGKLPGFGCRSDAWTSEAAAPRLPLSAAYVAEAGSVVPQQLLRAGARIAHLLNRAFGK
jgi:hypothetical protein